VTVVPSTAKEVGALLDGTGMTSTPRHLAIAISLAHGSEAERATREQLQRLLGTYDLQPWQFTDRVVIDQQAIPHSHPVLTLHTRHLDDDVLLLSTYLHEQLQWFITAQADDRVEPAIAALEERYPCVPIGFPKGAETVLSSYFHHIICYLEYLGLRQVVGEEEARRVMDCWQRDHYTEIYQTVMQDTDAIGSIVRCHGLTVTVPSGTRPAWL
jgi:hypothetical protein